MLARRWFSLSGVVPLAFFLLEHVWLNASAMRGQSAYVARTLALSRVPFLGVVELALVALPLAYHSGYGLWIMRAGIPRDAAPYGRRLSIANRSAAVVALAFIAWHLWEYRIPALRGALSPLSFYGLLAWRLSSVWYGLPLRAMLYVLGIAATAFHFAVSTWGWGVTSSLFVTDAQKKRAAWGLAVIGSLVCLVAAATVIPLATGMQSEPTLPVPPCGS